MRFFTPEWAEAARAAVDAGPVQEGKLPSYWTWIERARTGYTATWALGVRETGAYLVLTWKDGKCVEAEITSDPAAADFVLAAGETTWADLRNGGDPGRAVMYRGVRLERGEVLAFFRVIYFFIESLATLSRIPAAA
ncbi:hypothetical protein SAMN05444920_10678 [Nonomuraea solani]|uniref:SCP-2 sterol transfer family protein n=1 Tax=Nonomuraea solani TaxID=1144553 RepID=A0A1H6DQ72_9ACTN|nr:hypothetical protein [Nonomuraea solani]SEG87469.1 hypothetical protein SAMN05444920_10678 [Nonomuraea solani]